MVGVGLVKTGKNLGKRYTLLSGCFPRSFGKILDQEGSLRLVRGCED